MQPISLNSSNTTRSMDHKDEKLPPSPASSENASYFALLQAGQKELVNFASNPNNPYSTGLESSLVSPFLEQIMALNQWMNTTASTNFPADPLFQEMFVEGWIHKDFVSTSLLSSMNDYGWTFLVSHEKTCCARGVPIESGTVITSWQFSRSREHLILHHMLSKWIYNKLFSPPTPVPAQTLLFQALLDETLPQKFRVLFKQYGFLGACDQLSPEDWKTLSAMHDPILDGYDAPKPRADKLKTLMASGAGSSAYCCVAKSLIQRGDVLWLYVANERDPTDRSLYVRLAELLTAR